MLTSSDELANQVHQFLLSPDSYPEKPRKVELKETHISWVYLTDRFAYKRKKPVKFEFLDFSTAELRKQNCDYEISLNRRFSPEVYLTVIPVTRELSGMPNLNGHGEPIDWLVKMKRLDDRQTLENIIRREELTDVHVRRLAETLSAFYVSQAPAMVRTVSFRQALADHIAANRVDLLSHIPDAAADICYATNSQARFLHLQSDYFDGRVCDGCVVDGHGDLRAEHIYMGPTKPHIIDCIEFNSEYRKNDIIDELAFLAMECDRLGAEKIGEAVLAEYSAASRDKPSSSLISFYKSYRACVRAKVAALRATQQTEDRLVKSHREANSYLQLALEYARDLGPNIVILVGGLTGTGKSTLASALQEPLAAEMLRSDLIRNEFFKRNGDSLFGQGKYSQTARNLVYETLVDRLGQSFRRSPTVLLDATFADQVHRQHVCRVAKELGATVLQSQCVCPAEVAIARVAERPASDAFASESRPEIYHQQALVHEPPLGSELLVEVDTTESISQQVNRVISQVRQLITL